MNFNRRSVNCCCLFSCLWIMCLISTHTQGQNLECSFHYDKKYWTDAVLACMDNKSELLCYSDRTQMMTIVKAFLSNEISETTVKIWLISTNCTDFEENHKMEVCLYLNVNKTNEGGMWPFFQISCSETLPFICCKKNKGQITKTTTVFPTTPEKTKSMIFTTPKETSVTATTSKQTNVFPTTPKKTSVMETTPKKRTSTSVTMPEKTTSVFITTPTESTSTFMTSHENTRISSTLEKSSISPLTGEGQQTSYPVTYPASTTTSSSTEFATKCPVYFCETTTRRGIDWRRSPLEKEISEPCPGNSIGMAKWTCNISGTWTPENPDMSNCQSLSVLKIKEKYFSLPSNDTIDEIDKILKNESDVYGNDLMDIVSITASLPAKLYEETASLSVAERWSTREKAVKKTTSIIDNIIGLADTWDDLSQEETVQTGSNILQMVDDFGVLLADALFESDSHNIFTKYIAMQVLRLQFGGEVNVPHGQHENFGNLGEHIVLSEGYDAELDASNGNLSAVFARYTNMNHILLSSTENQKKGKENILNSAVVSAVISQGRSEVSISTEAEISVRNLVAQPNETGCVFWNLDRNDWDSTGCKLKSSNMTHSVCICDHLTNFAVLMDFRGRIKDVDSLPFFYITVIGCSISIVCLALCIAIFTCYSCHSRNVWGLRYIIHRNLCLTLLIANLLLVTGLKKTYNQITCSIVAGLLHYFFLSAFSWMLLEGFHIYLLLVVVFASKRSHWEKYYIFGYGFPLLIVGITVIARPEDYGTEKVCWLSVEKGVIWSFTGPVACVLTVNCCALILAQWKASKMATKDDSIALIKRWLRVTLILFPILGITWLFGFFYVGKHYEVAAYLFATLNSLQGFCIFICHCVLDTKARNLVLNSLRKKQVSVATESSGTLKKLKATKKKRSIVDMSPVEETNLTPVRTFQSGKSKPLKQKWNVWRKPWTFYFNFKVTQNSQFSDSQTGSKALPKAVVLNWNIPHEHDRM